MVHAWPGRRSSNGHQASPHWPSLGTVGHGRSDTRVYLDGPKEVHVRPRAPAPPPSPEQTRWPGSALALARPPVMVSSAPRPPAMAPYVQGNSQSSAFPPSACFHSKDLRVSGNSLNFHFHTR